MNYLGLLIAASGIFCVCGAAFDWGFFMNSRKTWVFKKMFGHNGARVFYVLLGIVVTIGGIGITLGIIKNST